MVCSNRLEDLEDEHEAAVPDIVDHIEEAEDRNADGYDLNDNFEDR